MQTQSLDKRYRLLIGTTGESDIGLYADSYDTLFDAKRSANDIAQNQSPHAEVHIQDTTTGEILASYRGLCVATMEYPVYGKPH